ncbi:MAG TPA: diguanylate cyclase [Geobacteraceae bacterium]
MENGSTTTQTIERLVNFITFTDLPIRRKFLLFAIGVLFWFVAMFAVIVVAMYDLEGKSETVVKRVIPRERATQEIVTNLQRIIIDSTELARAVNAGEVMKKAEKSSSCLDAITTLVGSLKGEEHEVALLEGGRGGGFFSIAVAGASEADRYLAEIVDLTTLANQQLDTLSALKLAAVNQGSGAAIEPKLGELRRTLEHAITLSNGYALKIGNLYTANTARTKTSIHYALAAGLGVLLMATALLALFTFWISRSIARPVHDMIGQIQALHRGDLDLSKRIAIASKDEIGVLCTAFNGLMESIHGMSTFKKVIEEEVHVDDVYARLGAVISDQHGLSDYVIYEISNSRNRMKPVHPVSTAVETLACSREILENCDLCKAKKTGRTVASTAYPGICRQFVAPRGTEHVCIPMMIGGSTGGVVQLRFERPDDAAALDDLERRIFRAQQYVNESVSVIEAKRLLVTLRESALIDPLTGLHNRRFLQEHTEEMVAGVRRRGKSVGLIMCDLDYFKQVNDVHGHNAGDVVLKETSLIVRKSIRESDIVIRFGGEEFLVVLIDIEEGQGMLVAEKIRESVEKAHINVPHGAVVSKTISLGVSEFPCDTESFWQAIKFSDVALYKAKEAGRNRVKRYEHGMWPENQF